MRIKAPEYIRKQRAEGNSKRSLRMSRLMRFEQRQAEMIKATREAGNKIMRG